MKIYKKKVVQYIAVCFLLVAVFLLIPNTNWNERTSLWGFLSLVSGTVGSLVSIFIPENYTQFFTEDDWTKNKDENEVSYSLIINSKNHGFGKTPHITTYEMQEEFANIVGTDKSYDKNGNVILTVNTIFAGKVVIS